MFSKVQDKSSLFESRSVFIVSYYFIHEQKPFPSIFDTAFEHVISKYTTISCCSQNAKFIFKLSRQITKFCCFVENFICKKEQRSRKLTRIIFALNLLWSLFHYYLLNFRISYYIYIYNKGILISNISIYIYKLKFILISLLFSVEIEI